MPVSSAAQCDLFNRMQAQLGGTEVLTTRLSLTAMGSPLSTTVHVLGSALHVNKSRTNWVHI